MAHSFCLCTSEQLKTLDVNVWGEFYNSGHMDLSGTACFFMNKLKIGTSCSNYFLFIIGYGVKQRQIFIFFA